MYCMSFPERELRPKPSRSGSEMTPSKADADKKRRAEQLLAAHGEAFLSMFDDDGSDGRKVRRKSHAQTGPRHKLQAAKLGGGPTAAAGDGHSGSMGVELGSRAATARMTQAGSQPKTAAQQRASTYDEIDAILGKHSTQQSNKVQTAQNSGSKPSYAAISNVPIVDFSQRSQALAGGMASKQELARQRKLFMSAKVGKVHEQVISAAVASPAKGQDEIDEPALSPDEFKRIQLEVEKLGASALDKKEHKRWKAAMLARLGAKPDKACRMSAKIGKSAAAKQAQRAAKELEEAIEAGMAKRKGRGKKLRAEKAKDRDWGLQELGRGFKGGTLRIAPLKKQGEGSGGAGGGPRRSRPVNINPVRAGKGKGEKGKGKKPKGLPF